MIASAWTLDADKPLNLSRFKELLLGTCGLNFENEREQALSAGLCRRMAEHDVDDHDVYFSLLLHDSGELLRLTELLTVNETYFFREPDHLRLLVEKLVPEFMVARNRRPIKIVSAGCSTGEEPYTLAIMLRERFGNESETLFSITGVDIDSTVISSAKQGVYGKSSFRGMDQALFERYFEPYAPDKFRVKDTIRKHAEFDIVNLLGSAYPQSMHMPDVILYRNVSIYFPGHIQRKIFGKLAELLADGGCLMVGASETIHHDIGLLSLVKQDSLFFYHKPPTLVFEERRKLGRHPMASERPSTRTLPVTPLSGGSTATHQNRTHAGHVHDLSHKHPQFRQPDVKGLFDTAIELAHTKKYDEALAALDIIIDQDNTFEKAHCLKGSLLLNTARFDESRTVCEAVLAHNPLCLAACLMLGITARHNGDIEGAFKRFRDAIYLDPSCWLAHFYSAEILFAQREDKRARSGFEAALKILVNGQMKDHGQAFFPLSFNAEQFTVICRHKLSLLKEN